MTSGQSLTLCTPAPFHKVKEQVQSLCTKIIAPRQLLQAQRSSWAYRPGSEVQGHDLIPFLRSFWRPWKPEVSPEAKMPFMVATVVRASGLCPPRCRVSAPRGPFSWKPPHGHCPHSCILSAPFFSPPRLYLSTQEPPRVRQECHLPRGKGIKLQELLGVSSRPESASEAHLEETVNACSKVCSALRKLCKTPTNSP